MICRAKFLTEEKLAICIIASFFFVLNRLDESVDIINFFSNLKRKKNDILGIFCGYFG